jgi:hypothetical protein
MKRILFYSSLLFIPILVLILSACNDVNSERINSNETENVIYIKDNMFVFQNNSQLNETLMSFDKLSEKEKKEWHKKYGIQTYGQIFREIIKKEDSISTYYFSLSEQQQQYFRNKPQVYSDLYKEALAKGIIKIVKEKDNEYFDLNLIDKKYAEFTNLDGKVIIGNNILSIDGCEEKIYLNAIEGSSKIDYTKLKSTLLKTNDETDNKLKSDDIYSWSQISDPEYYDPGLLGNRKKVWAEIEGSSHLALVIAGETTTCARWVYCIFDLKGYAQKRNFWGNFVFGNWSTNITFDASWNYEHYSWDVDAQPGDNCLCGYYDSEIATGYNNFPAYGCYPNPATLCPTSPYYEEAVGNGCIRPLTPEGMIPYEFGNGGFWWARPIKVFDASVIITIDGKVFEFQW